MPNLSKRKVMKHGNWSLGITLPRGWVEYYKIKPGTELEVISNGKIMIKPPEEKKK